MGLPLTRQAVFAVCSKADLLVLLVVLRPDPEARHVKMIANVALENKDDYHAGSVQKRKSEMNSSCRELIC